MKLLGFAYLAVLLGVNSATAQTQMQINYYSDPECTIFSQDIDVTWATTSGACHNFNSGNSVSIANCYENNCTCIFYLQQNCQGNQEQGIAVGGSEANCITDSSIYNSFKCSYD